MFHPSEMEEEATLREDLEDDIKTECLKMGPLEKVSSKSSPFLPHPDDRKHVSQAVACCRSCQLDASCTTVVARVELSVVRQLHDVAARIHHVCFQKVILLIIMRRQQHGYPTFLCGG